MSGPTWRAPQPEAQVAEGAVQLFRRCFGGAPDGVWAAPGRVNLIGEHIDYVGGRVLPFALPYLTVVAVRIRGGRTVRCASQQVGGVWSGHADDIGPSAPRGWAAYAVGVPWAMARSGALAAVPGLDIAAHSTVPLGSGLSSSAALECAVALAVAELSGLATDDAGRAALARDCVAAENHVALASTGGMDQSAALRARAGHAMLLDCADFSTEHVPLDLRAAGLELVIIDTRAQRRLADGAYAQRRATVEQLCARIGPHALRTADPAGLLAGLDAGTAARMRHIITEMRRVEAAADVMRSGAAHNLGPLLTASHASLRDDYEVSSVELDSAVDAALDAGALGARMTGGGFGGCAIALVRAGEAGRVAEVVDNAAVARGLPRPQFLTAAPERSAHRINRSAVVSD